MKVDPSPFKRASPRFASDASHGEINAAPPISWETLAYLLFGCIAAALFFLASATYSRTVTVSGVITLDKGVTAVVPTQSGIITSIMVSDGDEVHAGQNLIGVTTGQVTNSGKTAPELMKAALQAKISRLDEQRRAVTQATGTERAQLTDQIAQLQHQIDQSDAQIRQQERLVAVAQENYGRLKDLQAKGFASNRDLTAGESDLLTRQQQLAQLNDVHSQKISDLLAARHQVALSSANLAEQEATIGSAAADLNEQLAQVQGQQGYTLVAPLNGRVTSLSARIGQPTGAQPLMLVVPQHAITIAELYVAADAAGFLKPGQPVRLSVDAFPFERFGTVKGYIHSVSTAATYQNAGNGSQTPTFLVWVTIPQPWIMAFGRREPLRPGMTLSARIITRSQTLVEWLFEPLFAVTQR